MPSPRHINLYAREDLIEHMINYHGAFDAHEFRHDGYYDIKEMHDWAHSEESKMVGSFGECPISASEV